MYEFARVIFKPFFHFGVPYISSLEGDEKNLLTTKLKNTDTEQYCQYCSTFLKQQYFTYHNSWNSLFLNKMTTKRDTFKGIRVQVYYTIMVDIEVAQFHTCRIVGNCAISYFSFSDKVTYLHLLLNIATVFLWKFVNQQFLNDLQKRFTFYEKFTDLKIFFCHLNGSFFSLKCRNFY